jgi:two-component system, chemotaxis family, response regulator Rcp1
MGGLFGVKPALRAGEVFHILVVDDDRAGATMLRPVMKNLQGRYELHFVWDGVEAIDFLRRDGVHRDAPRPNLVLLDINMPRLGGLETLSAIKSDPDLCVIPVIMLSTSNTPDDVRESYQAHANCFVQKPIDLERSVKLLQAIEAFWMEFVLLPATAKVLTGTSIAQQSAEARSQAMRSTETAAECGEHIRLMNEFGVAVRELLVLHEQQFLAIVEGDAECSRFDLLIHMANEQKQLTKYAFLRHVEAHGCSKL